MLHPLTIPLVLFQYPKNVATATGSASATHGAKKEYETIYVFASERAKEVKEKIAVKLGADASTIRLWDFYSVSQMALLDEEKTMSESNIVENNTVLVEYQHPYGLKFLVEGPRTFGGSSYSSGGYTSGYSNYNSAPVTRTVVPGKQGLGNLGNTCFMNSGLQCLSACVPLSDYFLSGRYIPEINRDNPIGAKGMMAEAYGKLLGELWSSTSTSSSSYYSYSYGVEPRQLKGVVERFAPQFAGYQQQDSQELLSFLLDGLHEDLNRILRKPYVEGVTGTPDDDDVEIAQKAWHGHKQRNDSFVVDHFQGQLKSKVVCPDCANVSITFDPFMYLSLPLPIDTSRWVKCVYVPLNGLPTRHAIACKAADTVETLFKLLASQLNSLSESKAHQQINSSSQHEGEEAEGANGTSNAQANGAAPVHKARVLNSANSVFCELNYGAFYERKKPTDLVDSLEAKETYYIYELYVPTEEEVAAAEEEQKKIKESEKSEAAAKAKAETKGEDEDSEDETKQSQQRPADSDSDSDMDLDDAGMWSYLPTQLSFPESYGYSNYVTQTKAAMPFVFSVPNHCTWKDLYGRICKQLAPYLRTPFPDYDKVMSEYRVAEKEHAEKVAEEQRMREEEAAAKKKQQEKEAAEKENEQEGAGAEGEKQTGDEGEVDDVERGGRRSPSDSDDDDERRLRSGGYHSSHHATNVYTGPYGRTSYASAAYSAGYSNYNSTPPSSVPPLAPPPFPFTINVAQRYRNAQPLSPASDKPLQFGNADDTSYSLVFSNKEIFHHYINETLMKTPEEHPSVMVQSRAAVSSHSSSGEAPMPLTDCLDLFCTEEQLTEENMWYCNRCKEHVRAIKKLELWSLPRILVVHLKRFHYSSRGRRDKISTLVQFPLEDLDLSPYLLGHLEGVVGDAETAAAAAAKYDLFAVSNHYGGLGGGHYTAHAKHRSDGSWNYYDDSSCRPANAADVQSTAAYVLFYHRKDVPWPKFESPSASEPENEASSATTANANTEAGEETSSDEERKGTDDERDDESGYKRTMDSSDEDDDQNDAGAGAGAGAGGNSHQDDSDLRMEPHRITDTDDQY